MKKLYIFSVIFISLFYLAGFSSAAITITNPLTGVNNFCQLLTKIATGVGTLVASLGVVMIIVAGILFLTSAGSPEKIGTAKKALMYAIIGIAIGIAATAIVEVVKNVIGTTGTSC